MVSWVHRVTNEEILIVYMKQGLYGVPQKKKNSKADEIYPEIRSLTQLIIDATA